MALTNRPPRISADTIARIVELGPGRSIREVARLTGISDKTITRYLETPLGRARAVSVDPTLPPGAKATPLRRCHQPDCYRLTRSDPCQWCGKEWGNHPNAIQ